MFDPEGTVTIGLCTTSVGRDSIGDDWGGSILSSPRLSIAESYRLSTVCCPLDCLPLWTTVHPVPSEPLLRIWALWSPSDPVTGELNPVPDRPRFPPVVLDEDLLTGIEDNSA